MEFAGIFRALGAEVHLVYRQPLPLRGFDHDIREAMEEALMAQGIILHPNSIPAKLEADGDRRILTLGDGQTIASDLVFFATGRRANVKGLGLEKVGVELNAKDAIKVDDQLAHLAAAYLRHGRRDRPGEPDAGRHRRGPRAGRHPVRQQSAHRLVAEHSVRGVHHPAGRHRRA